MANVVEEHFLARPTTSKVGTEDCELVENNIRVNHPGEPDGNNIGADRHCPIVS